MATPTLGTALGQVIALTVRPARKAIPLAVGSVEAICGQGLAGDMHADALSPRHILLASRQVYEDLALPFNSLRENLLIDFDTAELASGTVLQIGEDVRIWLTFQCEACGHLNMRRPALSRDIGTRRGVLARVLTGGIIKHGDAIYTLGVLMPEWSNDWRHRVSRILSAVPEDAVIEYLQLARLAGVPSSYCRVFPRIARTLDAAMARKAVPLNGKSDKRRWQGEALFDAQLDAIPSLSV